MTAPRPVLLGERLHCPKCANELDIWEETRQVDRIGYTAPRWDNDAEEWTYTSDGNPQNESVELLDRYAQCPARSCGYLAPVEDRYDAETDTTDDLVQAIAEALTARGVCTYTEAVELVDGDDRPWRLLDAFEGDMPDAGDYWTCPGCASTVEPSDVRRHASECAHVDGAGQPT